MLAYLYLSFMKKIIIIAFVGFVVFKGCTNNGSNFSSESYESSDTYNSSGNSYNSSSDEIYHIDKNYKYEYRTGSSGDYEYNYDVEGYDSEGNYINGNIDISGKYGSGTIEDEDGNEKDIDVEWIDHGVLEATDEDGNTFELEVD